MKTVRLKRAEVILYRKLAQEFKAGSPRLSVAVHYGVHPTLVDAAIRHYLKPGGR